MIDVHPTIRDAAIAYLYEPTSTIEDVAEEFGRSRSWVAMAVAEYRGET